MGFVQIGINSGKAKRSDNPRRRLQNNSPEQQIEMKAESQGNIHSGVLLRRKGEE
jgi:hypothetical protein